MKYATAAAFRTALEQRLLAQSRETGIPLVRLRKLVVFDRLLARLQIVAPERWTLKGAVALLFRAGPQFRTTLDIDFARDNDEPSATRDLLAVQSAELSDYFSFAIERVHDLDTALEGAAVRYHARAELAGRAFEDVRIDVAFGDEYEESPDVLRGLDLLGFADLAPIEVPVLPLALHVAEKAHAYTRVYEGGRRSSRVKDLIDLVLISSLFPFKAEQVRRALDRTFSVRGTHALPSGLPPPPGDWTVPYRRQAHEVGLAEDVSVGYEQARHFLDPVLDGSCPNQWSWNPTARKWQADPDSQEARAT